MKFYHRDLNRAAGVGRSPEHLDPPRGVVVVGGMEREKVHLEAFGIIYGRLWYVDS